MLITLEGIDGAGKSGLLNRLVRFVEGCGREVVSTREPGGTPLAEQVRDLLLDPEYAGMPSEAEMMLFGAARADHVARIIRPALDAGKVVISSRFHDATYAYQVAGRGLPESQFSTVSALAHPDTVPTLTLLLDLPVETALDRVARAGKLDRIESEKVAFFERVRAGYAELARREPGRFRVIDATEPKPSVEAAALREVAQLLETDGPPLPRHSLGASEPRP